MSIGYHVYIYIYAYCLIYIYIYIYIYMGSMSIGDHSLLGDPRWAGMFGVEADFVAIDDVKVTYKYDIIM